MCGIVGVVDLRGQGRIPSRDVVDRMTDALARRGPDGRGVWRAHNAALGHRRLAVLDPTDAAAQPMVNHGVALVFNGEIYNYQALRTELEQRGHTFSSTGDTVVLLAAWREWGPAMVPKLNGIFALAIVDERERRVFLARDHVGVKPLFFAVHDGVLRFGSEIKALLADPSVPRIADPRALDCFLTHGYAPQPLSPFLGIEQLEPASTWATQIGSGRAPVIERYWAPRAAERPIAMEDALLELGARLKASVSAQMVSDVPLGAFLSSGLDSASVVAEMVRLTSEPVRTFSIGFTQASFDERAGAAHTAQILGAQHHAEVVALDLGRAVLELAETNDDLLADPSLLAVDRLCAVARKDVTVALSGDGADEILAGYSTYPATYLARAWRAVPSSLRALTKRAVTALPPSTERYNKRDFALRFLRGAELPITRGDGADFAAWRIFLDDDDKRALLKQPMQSGDALGRYARAMPSEGTLLKRMLIADLTHYLPADMLTKVDRASMRHGLEVRVPFLDPAFIEFALALPSSLLLSPRGTQKRILRRHVERRIDKETAHRKKRGFSVPVGESLKGPLFDVLLDAVRSKRFAEDGPIDVTALEKCAREHKAGRSDAGFQLYAVLVLALWWHNFMARA